jgi:protein dithiol oxidoreductase (disulfide-forming)
MSARMIRPLLVAVLLGLCACSQQQSPAPAAQAPAAAPDATSPAATAPGATPPATTQSETEQARNSQETGAPETDHTERSDASLERMTALPSSDQLPEGRWKPGVNYQPVVPAQSTDVAPGKVEVMEVFWLGCPHCYALEPHVEAWLKKKPAYVDFVRVPVIWDKMNTAHARLFYTLQALGRDDLFEKAFTAAQAGSNLPLVGASDAETLRMQQAFAVQNGISADDFAKAFNSFSVNSNLARAQELTQRFKVDHVPYFIVNGKYTTDITMAGGEGHEDQLIQLLNDLAASEHH